MSDSPYSPPISNPSTGAPVELEGVVPNAKRLLWAGFAAILAAGVGFAIRGGILDNWQREFGFTGLQLGTIGGAGFTGFCFGIIIGGFIADKIGYGKLVIAAFTFHVLSAFVTFAAVSGTAPDKAYTFLFWGTFIFAIANGTLEAVANPLVATLFPQNRTHYLNILHASWPAGMVLGGMAGWVLDDKLQLDWKIQLALFLIPTVFYGFMFLGQPMPKSEASKQGLSLGEMLKDVGMLGGAVVSFLLALFFGDLFGNFTENKVLATYAGYGVGVLLWLGLSSLTGFSLGSILLFVLFVTHALVGAVELGTDGWIQNITGNILSSEQGKVLFVFTSLVMFGLRFCAHFIEKNIGLSPVGLLTVCAVLGFIGLNLTSHVDSFFMAILALTVYGLGKTFFWPTMLAVASDRFPKTGAVAISIMGGIGMMSAGLLGSPGLGYLKDRYSGEALQEVDPQLFTEYKATKSSRFLVLPEATGLDGEKLGAITGNLSKLRETNSSATAANLPAAESKVLTASIEGDRRTLRTDAFIPATMAVIYLALLLYFKSIGGYRPISISESEAKANEIASGEYSEA